MPEDNDSDFAVWILFRRDGGQFTVQVRRTAKRVKMVLKIALLLIKLARNNEIDTEGQCTPHP